MQACKLHLPITKSRRHHHHHRSSSSFPSSLPVCSLLFEPFSRSLALMLSDSSVLLYCPFPLSSVSSSSSFPLPTTIPPISTSVCFLRLLPKPNSDPGHVLFLSAAPHGSSILLRAWILRWIGGDNLFTPARMNFKRDRDTLGLVLDLLHGFSVELAGSVNVFVLHSPAARKIWVLAVRLAGEGGKDGVTDLMKCAVIECTLPIYSFRLSLGFLLLGEADGVRVFPLRLLVKGRVGKWKDSEQRRINENQNWSSNCELPKGSQKTKLSNGVVIEAVNGGCGAFRASEDLPGSMNRYCNGKGNGLVEENANVAFDCCCKGRVDREHTPSKLRTVKVRQNSGDLNSYFVAIKCAEVQGPESITVASSSVKAVSIHVLSRKRFLILDSVGDLHLLSLHNAVLTSEATSNTFVPSKDAHMRRLDYAVKVQMLAVLPDISIRTQIVWISDACHTVHMISVADIVENDNDGSERKLKRISAIQAMFTSEKIQDIVPLAAYEVLILGQGNIFAYAIA